jgi:hypothetical protein
MALHQPGEDVEEVGVEDLSGKSHGDAGVFDPKFSRGYDVWGLIFDQVHGSLLY